MVLEEQQVDGRRRLLLAVMGMGGMLATGLPVTAFARTAKPAVPTGTGSALENEIKDYLAAMRQDGRLAADEKTAWSVYDLTQNQPLVALNENTPFQCASMIKPLVALAYFVRHSENPARYPYDAATRYRMEEMIRDSNNRATNYFISAISDAPLSRRPRELERLLKRRVRGVFRQTSIMEFIPPDGRCYRNRASAGDYSRFLHALWHDRLPFAMEIKTLMGLPNHDRLVQGVPEIPMGTLIYDKTGTTARLCGDMGILVARGLDGQNYPYIVVGMIEKARRAQPYWRWVTDRSELIREISTLVYRGMKSRYPLA